MTSTDNDHELGLREVLDGFYTRFQSEHREISKSIAEVNGTTKDGGVKQQLDDITRRIQRLQEEYRKAIVYLPLYDQKSCQEGIKELESASAEKLLQYRPKPKFSFKNRGLLKEVPTESKQMSTVEKTPIKVEEEPLNQFFNEDTIKFTDRTEEIIEWVPESAGRPLSVHINRLSRCLVNFITENVTIASLFLDQLDHCLIFLPPVSSSILIQQCTNCTFVLACHQFRMHHTVNSRIFINPSSHPIIEECRDLEFVPCYPPLASPYVVELFKRANLSTTASTTNFIVADFNWQKSTPSPHWRTLPPSFSSESSLLPSLPLSTPLHPHHLLSYLDSYLPPSPPSSQLP